MSEQETLEIALEEWGPHAWVAVAAGSFTDGPGGARFRFVGRPAGGRRDLSQDTVVGAAFPVARRGLLADGTGPEIVRERLQELEDELASLGWARTDARGRHWWALRYTRSEPRIGRAPATRPSASSDAEPVPGMREVRIDSVPLEPLARLLEPERAERLAQHVVLARRILEDRTVWNVSATAFGGGVAEMLTALLAYTRGTGVDARWLVLEGNPRFFRITKRLHNVLHGTPGDGGPLGEAERDEYESVLAANAEMLLSRVRPGDLVLLHDPQTAGLVEGLRAAGAHVVWRCHIGRDAPTELTDLGWRFLEPYVSRAEATVFSRDAYVPACVDRRRARIIAPSLDPFSAKNVEIPPAAVAAALRRAGLVAGDDVPGSLDFDRRDGTSGTVRAHGNLVVAGGPVPEDARVVLQVSRWDRLKDMEGVLTAFATHLDRFGDDVHLMLVGPDVLGVSDDPEGAEVLFACVDAWKALPEPARERIHLVSLPMDDVGENAHLTNALQRHAAVVVQKSLVEGFGLTVTEAMWKHRPLVASAVGGIQDQITDGVDGLLLADPADPDGLTALIARVLDDAPLADRLGAAAAETVRDRFLGDRHLIQYVDLFDELLAGESSP